LVLVRLCRLIFLSHRAGAQIQYFVCVSAAQIFSSRAEVTPLKDSFLLLVFLALVAVDPGSPSRSIWIVLHAGAHRQDPAVAVRA
jgi:hypothetical protein